MVDHGVMGTAGDFRNGGGAAGKLILPFRNENNFSLAGFNSRDRLLEGNGAFIDENVVALGDLGESHFVGVTLIVAGIRRRQLAGVTDTCRSGRQPYPSSSAQL